MQVDGVLEDDLDVETWVDKMIEENGYAQLSVFRESLAQPGYAYTVGLEKSRKTPEIVVMGVQPDDASNLFAICIAGHDGGQCDLGLGAQDVTSLVDGFTLRFRPLPANVVAHINASRPERRWDMHAMLQLVLADNSGHFPGDPKCDPEVSAAQDPDKLLARVAN